VPYPYQLEDKEPEGREYPAATYLPILKSRQGEMNALNKLDEPIPDPLHGLRPVIELVDVDVDGLVGGPLRAELDKIVGKVVKAWPPERSALVIIDAGGVEVDTSEAYGGHMDDVSQQPVSPVLLDLLRTARVHAIPVIRLSDQDAVVSALGDQLDPYEGACVRVTAEDLDDTVVPLEDALEDLLDRYGLTADAVDLLLDFGTVVDEDALSMASRLAKFVLPSLRRLQWRTFAVGAGAFPVDLSGVQPGSVASLRRLDRDLWHRVKTFGPASMAYADYAVTHPRLQTGVAFAAPPQLRYTAGEHWLVSKGRRTDRRGHRQFFDICERIRSTHAEEVSPADWSWGDAEFHIAASKAGSEDAPGMGNASTWRAIATSHHLAHVRRQMTVRREP
jgi:hypothetical protein